MADSDLADPRARVTGSETRVDGRRKVRWWLIAFAVSGLAWVGIFWAISLMSRAAGEQVTVAGYTLEVPPERFIYEPTVPFTVRYIAPELLAVVCGEKDWNVLGCAVLGISPVRLFLADGMDPELEAHVRDHEIAHINGWQHGEE